MVAIDRYKTGLELYNHLETSPEESKYIFSKLYFVSNSNKLFCKYIISTESTIYLTVIEECNKNLLNSFDTQLDASYIRLGKYGIRYMTSGYCHLLFNSDHESELKNIETMYKTKDEYSKYFKIDEEFLEAYSEFLGGDYSVGIIIECKSKSELLNYMLWV